MLFTDQCFTRLVVVEHPATVNLHSGRVTPWTEETVARLDRHRARVCRHVGTHERTREEHREQELCQYHLQSTRLRQPAQTAYRTRLSITRRVDAMRLCLKRTRRMNACAMIRQLILNIDNYNYHAYILT